MIYQEIEFHNVDHLEKVEGMSGLRLARFPEEFNRRLGTSSNCNGRFRANRAQGCELRFVTDANFFDLALSAAEEDNDIMIYYGDMAHSRHTLKAGIVTVLHVAYPERYGIIDTRQLPPGQFSPWVWRIQSGLNGNVYFHYLDTFGFDLRPPKKEEKPEILWAAYGSSITCGSRSNLYACSYVNQAAIHLGYDVMNKGLSGSCLCEALAADYLARLPVDVLTLELGVNMVMHFDEAEYRGRIDYLLEKLKDSPAKRIYVIDMFPNKGLIASELSSRYYVYYRSFKAILREHLNAMQDQRFHSVPGEEIVKDLTYLSTDMLHPSDNGHIRMGINLAGWIKSHE